jgi:hypothetical protein
MRNRQILILIIGLNALFILGLYVVATAVVWPISNSDDDFADIPTSPFGIRKPSSNIYDHHEGLDIYAGCGTPIHSIANAYVRVLHQWDGQSSAGKWVLLEYVDNYSMGQYMHLQDWEPALCTTMSIYEGSVFAYSGNTGTSSCHLHYGYIDDNDYDYGPRVNPICQLPFWDHDCPSLYIDRNPIVTYAGGKIDYIDVTTCVSKSEMDFARFEVWLYEAGSYGWCAEIYVDDYNTRDDNNADDAEYHGNFTFFKDDPYYELSIQCRPRNYNPGDAYHKIDWRINPKNNTTIPNEDWIGIFVDDYYSGCASVAAANWGNTSHWGPELIVSQFWAEFVDSAIKVHWEGFVRDGIAGMNILKSNDSLGNYEKVNDGLLPIGGVNNLLLDKEVKAGKRYYYTYELVYSDGRKTKSGVYATVDVLVPTCFVLEQNAPNPFNPQTTITYSLPPSEAGRVTLDVFNILGQRVVTLVDKEHEAGSYSVTWDGVDAPGNSLASGIYFYRLTSRTSQLNKKMLLLK